MFTSLSSHTGVKKTLQSLPDNLNILLVEDNIINQKVGQSIFKNIGYEIDLASNGSQALEMVKKKEYDIIFMDLFMPEMDGFEAATSIRKFGIETPIIAMSADIDDQRRADAKKAGMTEFLAKPAKIETVKQLLLRIFSDTQNFE